MKHNFRELKIWQKSKNLCLLVYRITKEFPSDEKFGLINQIRRCSVSVPSNIAEGCGRNTDLQLIHYLNIAMGSLSELETQLLISKDLGYINKLNSEVLLNEVNEIQKMLSVFSRKLKSKKIL